MAKITHLILIKVPQILLIWEVKNQSKKKKQYHKVVQNCGRYFEFLVGRNRFSV